MEVIISILAAVVYAGYSINSIMLKRAIMLTKKIAFRNVWMILLIFSPAFLWAQNEAYHGGNGSGDNNITAALSTCSAFRFSGGNGDGDSTAVSALTNCSIFRFGGGNGDGDSTAASATTNCSIFRFGGGYGDGDSTAASSLTNCNSFRFAGDTADGNSAAQSSLTNCNTFRFAGDTGAGYKTGIFLKPRNFLGNDTSVTIICSEERFNLLSLYNFNGITIAWNTVRPDSAFTGNFRAIGTTNSGCVDTAFALVKQEIAVWNGSTSNNWHTAANWNSNRIPDETTHVIIPGGTPNPCVISTANANAASVQGKINGNFSIINNRNLIVSGRCVQVPSGQ
jgi:hypothetical protein